MEYNDYSDMLREARRELERKKENLLESARRLEDRLKLLDALDALAADNRRLADENETLKQQLNDERLLRADMETRMNEMSKLSAGVAKKASQDDLEKALRIFLNISRRKTPSKREAAKTVITEMLASAKLDIPDDIRDMLDHLDDEQADPKTINVQGNYNDIHDNGRVSGC